MLFASAFVAAAAPAFAAGPEEWPRWRGPRNDGISHEPIAAKWPDDGPKKFWSAPTGIGFSSPIGFDGKVYLFHGAGDTGATETLTCYDAETGKPAWSEAYEVGDKIDYPGPRATPAIDSGKIYTFGAAGDLVCRELAGGKLVWRLNVIKETHAELLGSGQVWASASSPLVAGKLVYVQGGKGGPVAVAVDKDSGKIAWQAETKGLSGYAAPVLGEVEGMPQLFILAGDAIDAFDPATGKAIWSLPWQTQYDINASTPIFDGSHLFVTSGSLHGGMMLELTKTGAKKVWENKIVQAKFQAGARRRRPLHAQRRQTRHRQVPELARRRGEVGSEGTGPEDRLRRIDRPRRR